MVPMIEIVDKIMSVIIVNLREVKKDHKSFRNELFKGFPPFMRVSCITEVRGYLVFKAQDSYSISKHLYYIQSHFLINEKSGWRYEFNDRTFFISKNV